MRAIQNAGGHVGLTARNYPIATNTAIKAGQVVKLSGGLVISAAANETGAILGIAAENHGGAADALNLRANGTEILVYDNPELIFECPAPVFTASGGSATTVTAAASVVACSTADAANGGYLKLAKKAASSTNTEKIGAVKTVTDYAQANSVSTFTHASAGTAVSGDEYLFFPPLGSAGFCALDSTNKSHLVVSATGATKIKVIGHDMERDMLLCMAVEHALGVEN